jgi:hypothetical protein
MSENGANGLPEVFRAQEEGVHGLDGAVHVDEVSLQRKQYLHQARRAAEQATD